MSVGGGKGVIRRGLEDGLGQVVHGLEGLASSRNLGVFCRREAPEGS